MANENRGRFGEPENRGMFGYEGEGYMRGEHDRDRDFSMSDRDDFGPRGYGRPHGRGDWGRDMGYRGDGPGYDRPRGYSDLESDRGGFRANDYGDFNRGDYNRGDYNRGAVGQSSGNDWGTQRQSFRGRGPKNYQRSDERIREDVCELLSLDDFVDATEIEVNVSSATVTLTGTVQDRREKRRAEDIVESVTGVKDVQNQIRVPRDGES
ncbi:MAG TPA: BON domain-containing protein [Thermoanaerobaculia bacterium]